VQYDFDTIWNVQLAQQNVNNSDLLVDSLPWPSPALERERAKKIKSLRDFYVDEVQRQFKSPAPDDAFSRWLLDQCSGPGRFKLALTSQQQSSTSSTTVASTVNTVPFSAASVAAQRRTPTANAADLYDPILPAIEVVRHSDVLRREVIKNLPSSLYIPWSQRSQPTEYTMNIVRTYVDEGLKELRSGDQLQYDATARRRCYDSLCEIEQRLNSLAPKALLRGDEILQIIERLQSNCAPFFLVLYRPHVDRLCEALHQNAIVAVQELNQFAAAPVTDGKSCDIVEGDRVCTVSFGDDRHEMLRPLYDKFRVLYQKCTAVRRDKPMQRFADCLYCMLRRHNTCFGEKFSCGFQAAAPASIFQTMTAEFEVSHEAFAAPVNCYYLHYNSAFPDVDAFFGSLGSFFDFQPLGGCFQLGTPNVEDVMDKAAEHVLRLLEKATAPMTFIATVPEWRNPPSKYLLDYERSRFKRADFVKAGKQYRYIRGDQHQKDNGGRYFVAPFETHVFVLQNDAGYERWKPTEQKMK
jgi:hypothetical protein